MSLARCARLGGLESCVLGPESSVRGRLAAGQLEATGDLCAETRSVGIQETGDWRLTTGDPRVDGVDELPSRPESDDSFGTLPQERSAQMPF